jgi:hypothetical protein
MIFCELGFAFNEFLKVSLRIERVASIRHKFSANLCPDAQET